MTTPAQAPDPFVGRVLPGGLRVLERMGTSSEGPLYRAQYDQTGQLVALTILRRPASSAPAGIPSLSEEHWLQLRRACQIRNSHVAGLLDVGETPEGLVYAVAEFLTGELLSDMLSVGGTVPRPQAVDICLQAAAGLDAAHRVGVVHGGVSPQTILVTPGDGERGSVKLIRFDFSAYEGDRARSVDRSADPRYASPERRAGHALDRLDDVFSLGAVLHHLLTGVPPDTGSAARAIPRALRRVLGRALASRRRRYSSVTAFAEDLERAALIPTAAHRSVGRRLGWLVAGAIIAAGAWFGWKRFGTEGADLRSEVAVGAPDTLTDSPPLSASADTVPPAALMKGSAPLEKSAPAAPPHAGPAPPRTPARPKEPAPPKASALPTASFPPMASALPRDSALPNRPFTPKASAPPAPSPASASRDSSARAVVSPFRRSHPWAARPDGRTYFPSSCRLAFESPDLVYFKTEAEARATGRSRSAEPACS
ncbi:MAG: serine/threonine-protein kinase [Gemmatimonadales bacterium]